MYTTGNLHLSMDSTFEYLFNIYGTLGGTLDLSWLWTLDQIVLNSTEFTSVLCGGCCRREYRMKFVFAYHLACISLMLMFQIVSTLPHSPKHQEVKYYVIHCLFLPFVFIYLYYFYISNFFHITSSLHSGKQNVSEFCYNLPWLTWNL